MKTADIENKVNNVAQHHLGDEFIYEFLLAYGITKATITRMRSGESQLSKLPHQVIVKKKVLFHEAQEGETGEELYPLIENLKTSPQAQKHLPRFIIARDSKTLLAWDTKTEEKLDIQLTPENITKHYDFFMPWIPGHEKYKAVHEHPADRKAAEKLAKLYDEILKNNEYVTEEDYHRLNVFLSRLLFCFFAEDTGIFEDDQFSKAITEHTEANGSDLHQFLNHLFEALNTKETQRKRQPGFCQAFPYVNGGLFDTQYDAPEFTSQSRKVILECAGEDWADINPDIFGSMIQAVARNKGSGSDNTEHYTSVPNIMKVMKPLFLDGLYEELTKAQGNVKALQTLAERLKTLRVFDPACGSGNFLIIAFKELRKLEIEIYKAIDEAGDDQALLHLPAVSLDQFYGIEIDDFACEVAQLSLWLAEHQMNVAFENVFSNTKPTLPLRESGTIKHTDAAFENWFDVCPKEPNTEIFVLGNPPYLGGKMQDDKQKAGLEYVVKKYGSSKITKFKNLDFIACWFLIGSDYIEKTGAKMAFVSTNSICQGEQVELLWPSIFERGQEIHFAHLPFKWENSAKRNAGVTVIIVGVQNKSDNIKSLYKDAALQEAKEINAYLAPAKNIIVGRRNQPLSNLPKMHFGNMSRDGGHLILSPQEKNELIEKHPQAIKYIRQLVGAYEFIRGSVRYCLWLDDSNVVEARKIPIISQRLERVKENRQQSKAKSTVDYSDRPHVFVQKSHQDGLCILIPSVTSERRDYIPMGIMTNDEVVVAPNLAIYDPEPWVFAVISSKMHMAWVKAVAGRLKTDYRYSSELCYNTFPLPALTDKQKKTLEMHTYEVLEAREYHTEKTIAELYDPNKMPANLRQAHDDLDVVVDKLYNRNGFKTDEQRLTHLFGLYEKMTGGE